MVAGHLQEKNGLYYMVVSYPDVAGKRKTKWFSTGLPIKGNKKKAEQEASRLSLDTLKAEAAEAERKKAETPKVKQPARHVGLP